MAGIAWSCRTLQLTHVPQQGNHTSTKRSISRKQLQVDRCSLLFFQSRSLVVGSTCSLATLLKPTGPSPTQAMKRPCCSFLFSARTARARCLSCTMQVFIKGFKCREIFRGRPGGPRRDEFLFNRRWAGCTTAPTRLSSRVRAYGL